MLEVTNNRRVEIRVACRSTSSLGMAFRWEGGGEGRREGYFFRWERVLRPVRLIGWALLSLPLPVLYADLP